MLDVLSSGHVEGDGDVVEKYVKQVYAKGKQCFIILLGCVLA